MMNYLWSGMILLGVLWAAVGGRLDAVTMGALDGAGEAVSLGITMLGVMAFWSGILEIAQNSGLVDWMSEKMRPVMRFLFPYLDSEHPAVRYMAVNMIANMLGLGSASTPAGLAAFQELEKLEEEKREKEKSEKGNPKEKNQGKWGIVNQEKASIKDRIVQPKGTASNEMCTFLILNISSLQLIPVSILAYRSQYGSINPAAIVGPAIAATFASTLAAVVFCKVMDR